MTRKLLLNSVSGITLYVTRVVVTFIMTPVYIMVLGNRDYGLWELVMSVIGYMGLLDLGISVALMRFVSVAEAKQCRKDLQETISTAFVFFVFVGLVAVLLVLVLSNTPNLIGGREIKEIGSFRVVFILMGINAGMFFPLQVFIATLMGVQRHYFINNVRVVITICQACLIYFLMLRFQGYGLIILALLTPVFTFIELALFAGAVHLDRKLPNISFSAIRIRKAKEMIAFGAKSAIIMISKRLQNQSVPLIIGHVIGLGHIVYFVMPNRLIEYAKGVSMAVGFPLFPYFGAAIGRGDHGELVKSWVNSSLALQIIALAMPVVILFCGEAFLGLWLGVEYAVAGRVVLYILVVGLVADSLANNAFRMLIAQGRHGKCAVVWFVLSALSIPMGVVGAYHWGIAGVAAGTTSVTVLANFITLYMACSAMEMRVGVYLRKTVVRVLFPLLLLASGFLFLGNIYPVHSYSALITHLVTSGMIYLLSLWLFTINVDRRRWLLEQVSLKLTTR